MAKVARETPLPTGVVTFLLTDVEGSTLLWERAPEQMAAVIARHYDILQTAIAAHGGARPVEQGEGDSVVAVFTRGSDAVAAALDAQLALSAEPWPDGIDLSVRMALHTGEARLRDEGNYAGETIIRTARLRSLAHGGQVIASRATVDAVADGLPDSARWIELGSYRLRNLGGAEDISQLGHPSLAAEFPPLRGLESVANNLPSQITPFIGREADQAQVHALIEDSRLLTLTGSGGCGKTRLALQVAADRLEAHPDGIWYVELAPLGETSSVLAALAEAMRVNEVADEPLLDSVLARLRDRRALIVIDNCEHLLDDAAAVISELLRSSPSLQALATSRQPLNLPGEVTWRVPSLAVPDPSHPVDASALDQFDAVRLFIDRAVRGRPTFVVTNDNAPHVAAICQHLDGIPLAIELAAARVRTLSVERIAEGLNDRFRLLRGGSSTLLPRQQTLRASVEWSYQLLSDSERVVLRRLAMFSGGFTLEAAEAVCAGGDIDAYDVFDQLTGLVDRSLVVADDESSTDRYRLLETIKQFAHEQLVAAGEVERVLDRHLEHYAALANELAPLLATGDQVAARARLEPEHDNFRVALVHAATISDATPLATLAFDLAFFWFQTTRFSEAEHWLRLAIEQVGEERSALRARLVWARGYINFYFGHFELAGELAEEAIATGIAAGDPMSTARGHDLRADVYQLADPLGSLDALREARALARSVDDVWAATDITQKIAYAYLFADRHDESRPFFDEAYSAAVEMDNPFFLAWHWNGLARTATRRADADAEETSRRALAAAETAGDALTIGWALNCLVDALLQRGAGEEAETAIGACLASLETRGAGGIALAFVEASAVDVALFRGEFSDAESRLRPIADEYAAGGATVGLVEVLEPIAVAQLMNGDASVGATIHALRDAATSIQSAYYLGHTWLFAAIEAVQNGDPDQAADAARKAVEHWQPERFDWHLCRALDVLAWASAVGGDPEGAGRWSGVAERVRDERRWHLAAFERVWAGAAAVTVGDDAAFGRGAAAAHELSLADAVALALRSRGDRLRPATGWPSLTPTERQVVALVAEGRTNPDIAERLFMSRNTVKTHLAHVFTKLGVSSRAELAAMATRATS